MTINWGLAQGGGGFQNALATGMQMSQMARKRQDEKEYRNALQTVLGPQGTGDARRGPYDTPGIGDGSGVGAQRNGDDPEAAMGAARQQAMAILAERNPGLYMKLQEREQEQAKQGQIQDAYRRVQAGDTTGLDDIFMLEPDLWKRLDDRTREGMKQSTSYLAQSALQIGRLPPEQRPAAWGQAVASAEQNGMDIPTHLEAYSDQALNYALASAEKTEAYIKQFEPDWRAVPQGGYLEDVNPLTRGGSAVPTGPGSVPPPPPGFTLDGGGASAPAGGGGGNVTGNFLDGF